LALQLRDFGGKKSTETSYVLVQHLPDRIHRPHHRTGNRGHFARRFADLGGGWVHNPHWNSHFDGYNPNEAQRSAGSARGMKDGC
jgi:hypothetical protein